MEHLEESVLERCVLYRTGNFGRICFSVRGVQKLSKKSLPSTKYIYTYVQTLKEEQILCFRTLSIVLLLSKTTVLFTSPNNVSDTGFCLRLQVKPTQFGPIDGASPYLRKLVRAPRWGIQAKHSTNHLRELRKHQIIKNSTRMKCCTTELSR
jgi:hypothetical protein